MTAFRITIRLTEREFAEVQDLAARLAMTRADAVRVAVAYAYRYAPSRADMMAVKETMQDKSRGTDR